MDKVKSVRWKRQDAIIRETINIFRVWCESVMGKWRIMRSDWMLILK